MMVTLPCSTPSHDHVRRNRPPVTLPGMARSRGASGVVKPTMTGDRSPKPNMGFAWNCAQTRYCELGSSPVRMVERSTGNSMTSSPACPSRRGVMMSRNVCSVTFCVPLSSGSDQKITSAMGEAALASGRGGASGIVGTGVARAMSDDSPSFSELCADTLNTYSDSFTRPEIISRFDAPDTICCSHASSGAASSFQ